MRSHLLPQAPGTGVSGSKLLVATCPCPAPIRSLSPDYLDEFLALGIVKPSFLSTLDEATKSVLVSRSFSLDIHFRSCPAPPVLFTPGPVDLDRPTTTCFATTASERYIPESYVCYSERSLIASPAESPPSSVPLPALQRLLRSSPVSSISPATPARDAHRLPQAYLRSTTPTLVRPDARSTCTRPARDERQRPPRLPASIVLSARLLLGSL